MELELAAFGVDLEHQGALLHRPALVHQDLGHEPADLARDGRLLLGDQVARGLDSLEHAVGLDRRDHHRRRRHGRPLDLGIDAAARRAQQQGEQRDNR